MQLEDLHGLFVRGLKELYSAENQIYDAFPELIESASDERLVQALQAHLEETRNQIDTLEQLFRVLGEDPTGFTCKGMRGLIHEARAHLEEELDEGVREATLIAAVRRIEHYELAAYETVVTYARLLGHHSVVGELDEILKEERDADALLGEIGRDTLAARASP